jgi:hypothetical protein
MRTCWRPSLSARLHPRGREPTAALKMRPWRAASAATGDTTGPRARTTGLAHRFAERRAPAASAADSSAIRSKLTTRGGAPIPSTSSTCALTAISNVATAATTKTSRSNRGCAGFSVARRTGAARWSRLRANATPPRRCGNMEESFSFAAPQLITAAFAAHGKVSLWRRRRTSDRQLRDQRGLRVLRCLPAPCST